MAAPKGTATMNVTDFTKFAMGKDPNTSVLVGAPHGVGKSSIIRQIANMKHKELMEAMGISTLSYGFEDFRLAQNDVGDVKGMPYRVGMTTYFAPPAWFPVSKEHHEFIEEKLREAGEKINNVKFNDLAHGVLLLDEINRAPLDVRQVAFQLVLDRELNGIRIPEGWEIFAAINDDDSIYDVEKMDSALINRFFYVQLSPTVKEWLKWAKTEGGVFDPIVRFIEANPTHLFMLDDDLKDAARQGSPTFTPRSWVALANNLRCMENRALSRGETPVLNQHGFLGSLAGGFIGTGMAESFVDFIKNDYRVLRPDEVLKKFDQESQDFYKGMETHKANQFCDALADEIAKLKSIKSIHIENVITLFKISMESKKAEVVHSLWTSLLVKNQKFAKELQQNNQDLILKAASNPSALG